MILEGIVTTSDEQGGPHLAPMGPIVDREITRLTLRPFQTSTTYAHLKRTGVGVLHVTDDVELIARAAIGRLAVLPAMQRLESLPGWIVENACRWFAFRVVTLDDSRERTEIVCEVVESGRQRDFFGFNRAKHAVLEAAILATRTAILPGEEIRSEFARLAVIVGKTSGDQEQRAFALLEDYVRKVLHSS